MDFQKGGGGGGGGGEERRSYPVTAADYKILEEVGQGVSATVYRALCTPFNETVAIKSLDLEKCISNLDEIRKEAQMMSLIAHANVVKAYCSFVVDRSLWVVMPYMAGGSCLHIMKSAYPEGFEEPVIATVLKEVLKALDYLHRHGHIHRDVKAGNILVDSNGQVKLGDFGVSACMFDTGDRQRSRNTFVGTPCWMAPEVMEQLHGYDFKADIWSFGITALELAHGHAPFSKYPPMKVLLMTLQNAPPGLDYERDKRFSKSFKEMIAMCLVKDPAKRPSAEKLLKHSFFKHARSYDYIAKHVLEGLPPLGERVKNLKAKDAARLAQKKMPYGEQEERSQNEYKRGVSSWNFNVEDLKAQAALLDDEEAASTKEVVDSPKGRGHKDSSSEDGKDSSDNQSGWSLPSDTREFLPSPGPLNSPRGEGGQSDRVPRARSGPLPSGNQVAKATNGSKPGAINLGRKESRHSLGRFEVEDVDLDRPDWHEDSKVRAGDERDQPRRSDEQERELDREEGRTGAGSLRSRDDDRERGDGRLEHRSAGGGTRSVEDLPRINVLRERNPSMPVMCGSSNKDVPDEKLKGTFVQKKGRFSVTSDDVALDDVPQAAAASVRRGLNVQSLSLHKSASVGDWASERERKYSQAPHTSSASQSPTHKSVNAGNWSSDRKHSLHSSSAAQLHSPALFQLTSNSAATVPVAAIFPHLQTMLQQCQSQQELVVNLLNSMHVAVDPPATTTGASRLSHLGSKSFMNSSSSLSIATSEASLEVSTDKERDLLDQVAGLQSRIASLVDELQVVKFRNVQLERQLNAIYNKEEEERIRKEEAAKEEG